MPRLPVRRLLVAGLAVVLGTAALAAQATERVLYVTALDEKTKAPADTLSPADLRVTEDGRVREVLRVTPATTPMPVAVLVDNQTAADPTIADLRLALASLLTDIAGLGPVALITVADRPTILQDYTTDAARLKAAAGRVFAQPQSGATLLDAIVEVSNGLRKREEDRAAIVLVTLERIEYSNRHYSQVLDALKAGGAMMSAVVLSDGRGSMQDDPARNRAVVLDRGIKETGGQRINVLASMAYADSLKQIARALTHQYRVVYARPQTLIPPERVAVAAAKDGLSITGAPARGQKDR